MFLSQPALLKNETREIKLNINSLKKKKKTTLQPEDYCEVRQAAKQWREGLYFCTDYFFKTKKKKQG